MSEKLPTFNVNNTQCVHCKKPIIKRVSMANSRNGTLQKGMIMVCSNCLMPMILGDTEWKPLTKADFMRLPSESKKQLLLVAKGLEGLIKSGAEWSPHDPQIIPGR